MTKWADIEGVSFDSGTTAKFRAGKAVAFGIFAVLAKNTQDDGNLTILRKDGNVVIFHVKGMSGHALRARLQSYLTEAGVPCLDDQPTPIHPPSAPVSAADETAKLASLHDSGILTEEEFAAHKAKLLDG